MADLTPIARTLQTLFTAEATRLARETGLVRRNSKLTGPVLLLVLVAGFIQHPTASYNILAQVAADYGVVVTRQAVQQRLTPAAVAFFQHLLAQSLSLLATHCRLPLPLLTQFPALYLLDSSQVALPAALRPSYPGSGGDGPTAGVKWHVLWELLTGSLREILGQPAIESDQRYGGYLAQIGAGSLILFDLGYVALARLQHLITRQIYFICRWNPGFTAFTPAGQPFDLRAYRARCAEPQVDLALRVGVQAQVPVRVVAVRLPPAAREQRRRRAHAAERKRGVTYSAAYKALLEWNIYVTNVPPPRLTGAQVSAVYRLRWQVELLFKLWKMQGALDQVAGQQAGRVMCELYAKLIGLVVFNYLTAPVRVGEDQELSPARAWQVWQRQITRVGQALHHRYGLADVLAQVYRLWQRFGQKDRRADRHTSLGQFRAAAGARSRSDLRVVEWRARGQPQPGRRAA